MLIYNVLFKGIEKNINPQVIPFRDYTEATQFVKESAKKNELRICSCSGFNFIDIDSWEQGDENTAGSYIDYRVEDKKGNSYYYVIYVQTL